MNAGVVAWLLRRRAAWSAWSAVMSIIGNLRQIGIAGQVEVVLAPPRWIDAAA